MSINPFKLNAVRICAPNCTQLYKLNILTCRYCGVGLKVYQAEILKCDISTVSQIQDNSGTNMTGVNIDVDADSKKGRFGWLEIQQVFLPVVYRGEEKAKYISQRGVEKILISNFKEVPRAALLCAEVAIFSGIFISYSFFVHQVDAVQMTRAEADVYNEINQRHLSRKLGMEMFTIKERMVKETEVHNLRAFLDFAEKRVANKGTVISSCEVRLVSIAKSCITPTSVVGDGWLPENQL